MDAIRQIVRTLGKNRPALLIGNGPNLRTGIMPSWKELLADISDPPVNFDLDGLSNTEVYDLIELGTSGPNPSDHIKQRVCDRLSHTPYMDLTVHARLMRMAVDEGLPVLTTNFDCTFERSIDARKFHLESKGFTRFYPWKTYYALKPVAGPTEGFGIWKVHGDINYRDSIRLGLSDYMGSVERSRKLIHNGDDRLFKGKREERWQGHTTWLHIWFNMPVIMIGFGCHSDEIFIRWLLIERKRYFNRDPRPMNVYYISLDDPPPATGNLLRPLGVQIMTVSDYSQIYGR